MVQGRSFLSTFTAISEATDHYLAPATNPFSSMKPAPVSPLFYSLDTSLFFFGDKTHVRQPSLSALLGAAHKFDPLFSKGDFLLPGVMLSR